MATVSARPLADTIRAKAEQDGIKFFFAQFVDMNAKPSAKLVPIENWEGLVTEGAGFAGFAAGPIGQTPASPDMMAIPDLASYTPVPFKPGPGPIRLRHHRRGQGVAVLPAHHPAPPAGAGKEARLHVQGRHGARVLPAPRDADGGSSWPTRSTGSTSPATT